MVATTSYQAGTEANAAQISYGIEATYGTAPATAFQAIRITGESLTDTKQRSRPSEINTTRESSAAVTTQESAGGAINYALSYATFDDLIASNLNADWQAPVVIASVAGDIALTNTSATAATLISTTAAKFASVKAGQWIRLLGFTNAANNGFYRVASVVSSQSLVLTSLVATVTETPAGTAAQVRAQTIQNGTTFKSLFLQKKLAAALWLQYAGAYISSWSLSGGIGQFLTGTFNVLAKSETNATVDASTGGVTAAPTGKVIDPIGGFVGVLQSETALPAVVDSWSITSTNVGAALEFGMGSSAAAGVLAGMAEVTGTIKMYFRDFSLYTKFKAETTGPLEFIVQDAAKNAYVITLLNAYLCNPQINAGGPNQPVYATFTVEGNPQAAGGTIQVDKLPAV